MYKNIMALQCKDCGDKKALKCKEKPKHDSKLLFNDKKYCTLSNPETPFLVLLEGIYGQ